MLLLSSVGLARAEETNEPAKIEINGYGFFGNRQIKSLIRTLLPPGEKPQTLDATFIEDSVLVIFSKLIRDGYLHPEVRAIVKTTPGERQEFSWTQPLEEPLPAQLQATELRFEIRPGVLFYYEEVGFSGLESIPLREAAHFFIEVDAPIKLKRNRIYSPDRLGSGIRNLKEALERKGFESATVLATNLVMNTNSGAVQVEIRIDEGPQSFIRSIELLDRTIEPAVEPVVIATNTVFSRMWIQDYIQGIRRKFYQKGFADVEIDVSQARREEQGNTVQVELLIEITPGNRIRVNEVRLEGEEKTDEAMLRQHIPLRENGLLNPIEAERGRQKLLRLGVFDTVELSYEQIDEENRDVVYTLDEGKRFEFSLLAGYGSYERLRAGFELEHYNIWGKAHQQRLRAMQSFKASQANYTYTIPQVAGREFDIFAHASGLRREEIAFTREEFGGGAGVSRHFREIASDLSVRYNYQVLNASRFEAPPQYGLRSANVSSFLFDLRHDMRDNPLTPREGYKIFANLEVASEALAGEVDFQRFEASGSYHWELGGVRWLHFGFSHGFITTTGKPEENLPLNKRFFPGGDNSIRGYQWGEAAPRDGGELVGAESYALANVEFEQGLTRALSFVLFLDALGTARRLQGYPFDQGLFSTGLGFRWKTLIGPARLEYGHNLNPREEDPKGTLHFSIGFPF